MKLTLLLVTLIASASGFVTTSSRCGRIGMVQTPFRPVTTHQRPQGLNMLGGVDLMDFGAISSSTIQLAETEAWVQPTATFLSIFLNFMSFAFLSRVVLSWYPTANIKDIPWILLVLPTEPLLKSVKGVIPPAFGVDITPVFWLAIFSFFNEILLGQQGLFTMKLKYGI